ncbi:MAG: glycerol-3-phosphate 1-O-acyltransferase PlsY [Nitrospiraceae bacterium]|nr:MAG: glycerol-3-phosphate 1-O-acyltransferase PlsY [Nitrospiraceae bacterium]
MAFVVGSIPTGLLLARSRGIDLQKVGSGNIGATNVLRTSGKWFAFLTLVGDMSKGAVSVLIAQHVQADILSQGITGLCAVLGHNFSLFLKFRGGKGVATSFGMLLLYTPQTALFTIIIWLLVLMITRYSSVGAVVSFGFLPISILFLDTKEKLPIAFLLSIMIFIRHKDNLIRLRNGTEHQIGKKK